MKKLINSVYDIKEKFLGERELHKKHNNIKTSHMSVEIVNSVYLNVKITETLYILKFKNMFISDKKIVIYKVNFDVDDTIIDNDIITKFKDKEFYINGVYSNRGTLKKRHLHVVNSFIDVLIKDLILEDK